MLDRLRALLSDFDRASPSLEVWEEAKRRTRQRTAAPPARNLRERAVQVAIAVLVVAAAIGGIALGAALHGTRVERPTRPPSKVGATTWLNVLTADVESRIKATRWLIRHDQCFTPQWSLLVSPVYSDMAAYRRISAREDPRLALGRAYTGLNNRCNTYVRRGPITPEKTAKMLAELRTIAAKAHELRRTEPENAKSVSDVWDALLVSDLKTRIPIAHRMLARGQCGIEVEQIAYPVQSDINLILLYHAPTSHTVREAMRRDPIVRLGPEFMRVTGPCYQEVRDGGMTTTQRGALAAKLADLRTEIDRIPTR